MPIAAVAAVATVGGAVIASSASKKASDAATQAADQNNQTQLQIFNQQRQDFQPYRDLGISAMPEVQRMLGIGAYAPPNAFAPVASTPVPGVGGVPVPGGAAKSSYVSTSPLAPDPARTSVVGAMGFGGYSTPPNAFGAPPEAAGGFNSAAYLEAHPDVAAGYQAYLKGTTEGFAAPGTEGQSWGQWGYRPGLTAEQFAEQHYNETGKNVGYAASTPLPAAPNANAFNYGPAVAPQPASGPRPDAARPDQGAAPTFTSPGLPDFSADAYEKSPGYDFQQKEGMRAINASFGARGVLNSGGALQEALRFGQGLAAQDYNQWQANQLAQWQAKANQFNTDRSTGLNQFNTDRSVTNQNFDVDTARGDARYDTDRTLDYSKWLDQRGYDTSRFDTKYANLTGLVGLGSGATGATSAAGQNYANAFGANNNARADAVGNAAIANSNTVNGAIGNAFNAYGMYAGLRGAQTPSSGTRFNFTGGS